MVEFDKILEQMGRLSRTQKIQLFLLLIPCVIVATHMGSMVFLGHPVDKRCEYPFEQKLEKTCNRTWTDVQTEKYLPKNKNISGECKRYDLSSVEETDTCSYWWKDDPLSLNANETLNESMATPPIVRCTSWVYSQSSLFPWTIASQFDLVCSDDYKRGLSQSIYMVGVTFGCVFWGEVSDRYGRKKALVLSSLIGSVIGSCVAFAPSYAIFVILKSISGFCIFAAYTTVFVIATEIVAPKNRVRIAQTTQAFFASGFCLLALYGYFVRDWRNLQLLLSIPVALFGVYYWIVYESPRWLIANKQYHEAKIIVEKFMETLGDNVEVKEFSNLQEAAALEKEEIDEERSDEVHEDVPSHGLFDLVKTPNMRSKSLKLFYCWLVCSCVYYGLTLNSADIGGDTFINLFLSGAVEIPAVFICIPILERWGRRPTLSFCLILAGVSCVGMLFVPKSLQWLNIALSMIGKFGIAGAFGTVYIFAAELYPTPVRNVGIGVCSSFARVGAIMSPFIAMLTVIAEPLPYVVFGVMSIVGGVLALFLPEVLGIRLPETIEEGEEFGLDQVGPLDCILVKLGCKSEAENRSNGHSVNTDYQRVSSGARLVEEDRV